MKPRQVIVEFGKATVECRQMTVEFRHVMIEFCLTKGLYTGDD